MLTFEGVYGGPVGTCRHNPPTDDCTWPIVLETDWCGNYNLGADPPKGSIGQCLSCCYFSEAKIVGRHPTGPA